MQPCAWSLRSYWWSLHCAPPRLYNGCKSLSFFFSFSCCNEWSLIAGRARQKKRAWQMTDGRSFCGKSTKHKDSERPCSCCFFKWSRHIYTSPRVSIRDIRVFMYTAQHLLQKKRKTWFIHLHEKKTHDRCIIVQFARPPTPKNEEEFFFILLIYNTCNPRQVVVVVEGRKERGYPFIAGLVLLLRWYANPFLFWRRTFQAYIWERGTHTRERKRAAYIRNPSK